MLTAPEVLQLLRRADLLWPVLPGDEQRAREMAQAWAGALDPRLTYDEALDLVEQHCREQHRPLAIVDLNEPIRHKHAPPAPRGTGALQRLKELEQGAVPCPPDVDLHRLRHVKPGYQAAWDERKRAERDRGAQTRRQTRGADELESLAPSKPDLNSLSPDKHRLAHPGVHG